MRKEDERSVLFLETEVEMEPSHAPPISMEELMNNLYSRFLAGDSYKIVDAGKASFRIQDMEIDEDNKIAYLLIHYYDTRWSDPVFGHLELGNLRIESKLDGEGIAVSAHLAISLEHVPNDSNSYLTLLEEAPGAGRSRVKPFLKSEVKQSNTDFTFKEDGITKKRRPAISMLASSSEGLKEDIEKGFFQGITLIKKKVKNFMDEDSILVPIEQNIKLGVSKKDKNKSINAILDAFSKAKKRKFDKMLIHYKNTKTKTVAVDTKGQDAFDAVFVKTEPILLDDSILQCEEKIHFEMKEKMLSYVLGERKEMNEN